LTPTCLVLPVQDRLTAVDPLTGRTLWSRLGEKSGSVLMHDQSNVYVIRRDDSGKATSTAAYRLADGDPVKMKDFAALYNRSRGVFGGRLLIAEPGENKTLSLRLVHPRTGRDVWQNSFPVGSIVVESLKPELTGVVEQDGTFHLIESATGKKLWKSSLLLSDDNEKRFEGVKAVRLIADARQVFLAVEKAVTKDDGVGAWKPLFRAGSGLSVVPLRGTLHACDRQSGRRQWYLEFESQMLLVGTEAEGLPVLIFAARSEKSKRKDEGKKGEVGRTVEQEDVRVVSKQNGKIVYFRPYRESDEWGGGAIIAIEADPAGRWVRLLCEKLRVELTERK
jgi:hypothetical protein